MIALSVLRASQARTRRQLVDAERVEERREEGRRQIAGREWSRWVFSERADGGRPEEDRRER